MNRIFKTLFNLTIVKNGLVLTFSWVFVLLTFVSYGQDPVFSRNTANPEVDNPAFAGSSRNTELHLIYRNQFPSLATNYITYAMGFNTFVDDLNSGFGLSVLYDDSADGLYLTTAAKLNYAYRLQLTDGGYLNAGLSLGFGRTAVDFDRLIFLDQIDEVTGPISGGGLPFPTDEFRPTNDFVNYLDMGAGALFYTDKFYVGGSLNHINNPTNDFLVSELATSPGVDGLPLRWAIRGGAVIPLIESRRETILALHPTALFTKQRSFWQLNAGTYLKYRTVDFGLHGRLSGSTVDAVIASVGVELEPIKFYYAYDLTISKLASFSGGAHEIGLSYRIGPEKVAEVNCFDLYR